MRRGSLVLIALFLFQFLIGQSDSSALRISILTCGAGDQLYTLFGHSGVRVQDRSRDIDVVYNYGTFDFNAPGFAIKFLRGKLDYFLSRAPIDSFLREYLNEQRFVREQVLDISYKERVALFQALELNLKKENRMYPYDFFFDNCVTRIRDKTEEILGVIDYGDEIDKGISFRDLLHSHLGPHAWTEFGMDLILGVGTDKAAGARGQMFLPSYYAQYVGKASLESKPLIGEETSILEFPSVTAERRFWTPMKVFGGLFLLELIVFFLFYISGDKEFMGWVDRIWFALLFISFIIMTFMWFATDHEVCNYNYNLLWTVPWAICAFPCKRKEKKLMFFLTIFASVLLLLSWTLIPQSMPQEVLFIVLISLLKSLRHAGFVRWMNRLKHAGSWTMIIFLLVWLGVPSAQAQAKISGITVVAPPEAYRGDPMSAVAAVHAEWIALVPYSISRLGEPKVEWGFNGQWWGESTAGIETSITLARKNNLKVMIKPQVWIPRGWVGDMDFDNEADWITWEESYREYIMNYVDIAVRNSVDMICIGTEYRIAVQKREAYWRTLISDIRSKYDGLLTYSSNWDSYEKVPFWDALDFVGISAYFPLSDMDTPMVMLLDYKWNKYVKKLEKYSQQQNKKILFTEYGYLSVDGAGGKTWELEKGVKSRDINNRAQANCYEALLSEFNDEEFWAGGFLWKWFPEGQGHEGYPERDYTPQGKPAEAILAKWHKTMNTTSK